VTDRVVVRRALLSVSDKRGLVEFATRLARASVALVSTGGTARTLRAAGLEVTEVAELTGAKEMLGGRVKTLHPMIHGGILYRRGHPEDEASARELAIPAIDLVAVNLYPFEATIADGSIDLDEALEMIDVGGPAMVRAAAKNWPHVVVATTPESYEEIAEEIESGGVSAATRRRLGAAAFAHTSAYDAVIASFLARSDQEPKSNGGARAEWPPVLAPVFELRKPLRYGENPHQRAAFYVPRASRNGIAGFRLLQGKELSYTNLLDLDAGTRLAQALHPPCAVVVKHRNPCGAAEASSTEEAFAGAWQSDPISRFGGVIVIRGEVNEVLARTFSENFIDIVAAESFAPEALVLLEGKKNLSLLAAPSLGASGEAVLPGARELRSVTGGLLVQDVDRPETDGELRFEVVTERAPNETERTSLAFAWQVARATQSNAVALASGTRTIGVGCGQTSRIDAVRSAIDKAKRGNHSIAGSVLASDAFFPFADSIEAAAAEGCTAVVQPGGSRRDAESIGAANRAGIAMVFTERRCFRH